MIKIKMLFKPLLGLTVKIAAWTGKFSTAIFLPWRICFVQLGNWKKTRFHISRYPSDSAKISVCLCCCCFLGWSVKMVRSCLLNPVSDSVSVPQRAVSPWFGAVSGQLTCRVLKWHKSLWIWIVRREIFSFHPRNPSETLWRNMVWLS